MRYVILGGGIAGTTAAEELRKCDAAASITIFDHEEHLCYSRVLLPHYVKGLVPREKVIMKTEVWYRDNRIELFRGTRVVQIDTRNKFVRTHEHREFPYDKLLIATGGEVNLAAEDPRGMVYLRTLDDADHLRALLTEVRALPETERRAAVIGGGFIALEFINIFAQYQIPTTVICRGSGFWSRTLSVAAQELLAAHARSKGVELLTEQEEPEYLADTALRGVRLHSGREIAVQIAGVGIGQRSDLALCGEAGIAHASGILANGFLETNVRDVYTAGDIAEFDHALFGRRIQLGNWLNAQMQGRAVAKTMAGERTEFSLLTSYATQLLGMHVVFIGDVSRAHASEVRTHSATPTGVIDLFMRDGCIVGAVVVGDVAPRAVITKAIQEKRGTI